MEGNFMSTWGDIINQLGKQWEWLRTLLATMQTILWVLLVLVGAAGAIYAIYVGVKMARAESAEQRDENKKRLINIIVSIVIVVVLILFFNLFLPMILDAFNVFDDMYGVEGGTESSAVSSLVNTARVILHI